MKQKKLIIFFPSIEEGGVEKNLFVISDFLSKKIKNISIITSVPNKIDNNKIKVIKSNLNIQNLLLATAAARKIGLSELEISTSLLSFEQLPHRLATIFKNNSLEIINRVLINNRVLATHWV